MCDYCDCRSFPPIAELSAEHDAALALIGEIRAVAAEGHSAELNGFQAQLTDLLSPHTEREEAGVFVELRRSGVGGYVDHLIDEHRQLDELRGASPERAIELVDLLERHILREETDVFPAARQLLVPGQWDRIDHVHRSSTDHRGPRHDHHDHLDHDHVEHTHDGAALAR